MTAPNISSPSTITAKDIAIKLTTTTLTSVLSNAASSGKLLKIDELIVSNINGSTAATITLSMYSAAALGGTAVEWQKVLSVPPGMSVVVIDRSIARNLIEDRSIGATAATANDLSITGSYSEIS